MPAWSLAGSVPEPLAVSSSLTPEDETGFVNAVIWESVFQRYSVLVKTVSNDATVKSHRIESVENSVQLHG
jgi:hypothetical protein